MILFANKMLMFYLFFTCYKMIFYNHVRKIMLNDMYLNINSLESNFIFKFQ